LLMEPTLKTYGLTKRCLRYNKRVKFARTARPTRKSAALLLAAQARRYA
jgi:ribosomal protein L15E